jgi:hypothetical protein
MPFVDPAERFAAMVAATAGDPDVRPPGADGGRGFGSEALRVGGSIVAMLVQGRVVLKLPRDRVEALICGSRGRGVSRGNAGRSRGSG